MATLDVLQRAAAAGANLVITHEPTFFNHLDETAEFESEKDPVYPAKQAFIREHHMVVWRFHDYWHRRKPDGVQEGVIAALGLGQVPRRRRPAALRAAAHDASAALGAEVKARLGREGDAHRRAQPTIDRDARRAAARRVGVRGPPEGAAARRRRRRRHRRGAGVGDDRVRRRCGRGRHAQGARSSPGTSLPSSRAWRSAHAGFARSCPTCRSPSSPPAEPWTAVP